jgi:hypothetical protein
MSEIREITTPVPIDLIEYCYDKIIKLFDEILNLFGCDYSNYILNKNKIEFYSKILNKSNYNKLLAILDNMGTILHLNKKIEEMKHIHAPDKNALPPINWEDLFKLQILYGNKIETILCFIEQISNSMAEIISARYDKNHNYYIQNCLINIIEEYPDIVPLELRRYVKFELPRQLDNLIEERISPIAPSHHPIGVPMGCDVMEKPKFEEKDIKPQDHDDYREIKKLYNEIVDLLGDDYDKLKKISNIRHKRKVASARLGKYEGNYDLLLRILKNMETIFQLSEHIDLSEFKNSQIDKLEMISEFIEKMTKLIDEIIPARSDFGRECEFRQGANLRPYLIDTIEEKIKPKTQKYKKPVIEESLFD